MSAPPMPPDLAALPPGLSAWTLEGEATLERLLQDVPAGTDDIVDPALFEPLAGQSPVAVRAGEDDEPVVYPLVTTSGALMSAMYSIPLEQASALLPATERLVPVRVTPRRAAVIFFAADVRRCPLGPYRELGVALPVVLDAERPPTPMPPTLWRDPSIGVYTVELPVDSERRAHTGERLARLPLVVGEARIEVDELRGRARFDYDGRTLADLSVRASRWARVRRQDISVQAYSLREGRIVRSRYSMVGEGYRGRRGESSIELGEHRRADRLARLELSRRPLELQIMPRLNWVAWAPEDAGAA